MATHYSIPAWRIPSMEEPCRLLSMQLQRVTRQSNFTSLSVSLRYRTHHSKCVITKWLVNIRWSTFITKFFSKQIGPHVHIERQGYPPKDNILASAFPLYKERNWLLFNSVGLELVYNGRCSSTAKWVSYAYTYIHSFFLDSFSI